MGLHTLKKIQHQPLNFVEPLEQQQQVNEKQSIIFCKQKARKQEQKTQKNKKGIKG